MYANMWKLGDKNWTVQATVHVVDEQIQVTGEMSDFIREGLQELWDNIPKKPVFMNEFPGKPRDEVFLRWLPIEFSGSYLRAEFVP